MQPSLPSTSRNQNIVFIQVKKTNPSVPIENISTQFQILQTHQLYSLIPVVKVEKEDALAPKTAVMDIEQPNEQLNMLPVLGVKEEYIDEQSDNNMVMVSDKKTDDFHIDDDFLKKHPYDVSYIENKKNFSMSSHNQNFEYLNLPTLPMQLILPEKVESDYSTKTESNNKVNEVTKQENQEIKTRTRKYKKTGTENNKNATIVKFSLDSCKIALSIQSRTKSVHDFPRQTRHRTKKDFIPMQIADRVVPQRAVASLPSCLQYRGGVVSPRRFLSPHLCFGPLQGVKRKIFDAERKCLLMECIEKRLPIFLMQKHEYSITQIDVSDADKSNWISLLSVGDERTANVWLFEEKDQLYGITTQPLTSHTPLRLGYSKTYAKKYELPEGLPVLDIDSAFIQNKKMEEKIRPHHRYRCKNCARMFSRLFTLKRHKQFNCRKNMEIDTTPNTVAVIPPSDFNINLSSDTMTNNSNAQNVEDSRLPSDESLQNFTNGLDFSTNLFDTDRMPNLDISVGSRSNEFPYTCYKDDTALTNDIGLSQFANQVDIPYSKVKKFQNKERVKNILTSCLRCNQVVVNGQMRQHFKSCKERQRFDCECGKTFVNKDKLTNHIYSEHRAEPQQPTPNAEADDNEATYKCEQCAVVFKRRGMLVNHLWRAHSESAVSSARAVPLARAVRHYPCAAADCRKLYRTAAKRDTHMRRHHPGVEKSRQSVIESGKRVCEPAACPQCPRQYATRAKMLQHVRAKHPHLAEALKQNPTGHVSRQRRPT